MQSRLLELSLGSRRQGPDRGDEESPFYRRGDQVISSADRKRQTTTVFSKVYYKDVKKKRYNRSNLSSLIKAKTIKHKSLMLQYRVDTTYIDCDQQ